MLLKHVFLLAFSGLLTYPLFTKAQNDDSVTIKVTLSEKSGHSSCG